MTCASFLISLFFATYLEKLKRFAPVVSFCFAGAAFFTLSLAQSTPAVFAGMVLLGFCMGTINPFFMSFMSIVAPDTRKTLGMTMMCIFQLGGQIFTPYYMMLVGSLGFSSERALFGFTAGIFIVAAIAVAVFALLAMSKERRKSIR